MNRKELLALQQELTVLRNIVPAALERVERLLSQSAPTPPAKKKSAAKNSRQREAGLIARLLTGQHKPIPPFQK